jgi:hypothetical protein
MATGTKWIGVAAAGVLLLGLAVPRAEAQSTFARFGNVLQGQNAIYLRYSSLLKQGINPYYQIAPGLSLQQASYNTRVMGRAYQSVPPYALGFNPYPPPVYGGVVNYSPYSSPYLSGGYGGGYGGGGYANPYANPYANQFSNLYTGYGPGTSAMSTGYAPSPSGYDMYSTGGGYGYDPYGGVLSGASNVIYAQGQYLLDWEKALILREKSYQARIETRKKLIEQRLWEQSLIPSLTEVQEKVAKMKLRRSQSGVASANEIWSGEALNTLLKDLARNQGKKPSVESIPLDEDVLKQINVTSPRGSNLGLLRSQAPLNWPTALRDMPDTKGLRAEVDTLASQATSQAATGKVDQGVLKDLQADLSKLRGQLSKSEDIPTGQYLEAKRFLSSLEDAVASLRNGDATRALSFSKDFVGKGKTVRDLVDYMASRGLQFAPAVSGDEAAYQALYSALQNYDVAFNEANKR